MSRDSEGLDASPFVSVVEVDRGEFDRLKNIAAVADRLWPAVRFFGLCGGSPEYVEAMIELGRLLGKIEKPTAPSGGEISSDAIDRIRRQAAQEAAKSIADVIRNGDAVRAQVGRRAAEAVADVIAELKLS